MLHRNVQRMKKRKIVFYMLMAAWLLGPINTPPLMVWTATKLLDTAVYSETHTNDFGTWLSIYLT